MNCKCNVEKTSTSFRVEHYQMLRAQTSGKLESAGAPRSASPCHWAILAESRGLRAQTFPAKMNEDFLNEDKRIH